MLLQRISQSVIVLGGTQFQPEGHIDMMQNGFMKFTPVTFEGYMMEIVKVEPLLVQVVDMQI